MSEPAAGARSTGVDPTGLSPTGSSVPEPEPADPQADELPYRMVRPYRVRFEEATAAETMRTAIYLAWAADIAWQHSTALVFGRDWYAARDLFWLVRAVKLDVLRPIRTYENVLVTTEVTGYRRIAARRHSNVFDASRGLLARLEIDWVMINERGVPTRVPDQMREFIADRSATFDMMKVSLPETPPDAAEMAFGVRRRDLDPLDHVNNSVYIDYFEEALETAGQGSLLTMIPRRYEIDFVASAGRGDRLLGRTWPLDGGRACRLSRVDGTEIFRAKVTRP